MLDLLLHTHIQSYLQFLLPGVFHLDALTVGMFGAMMNDSGQAVRLHEADFAHPDPPGENRRPRQSVGVREPGLLRFPSWWPPR